MKFPYRIISYEVYAIKHNTNKLYSNRIIGNLFPSDLKDFFNELEVGDLIYFNLRLNGPDDGNHFNLYVRVVE